MCCVKKSPTQFQGSLSERTAIAGDISSRFLYKQNRYFLCTLDGSPKPVAKLMYAKPLELSSCYELTYKSFQVCTNTTAISMQAYLKEIRGLTGPIYDRATESCFKKCRSGVHCECLDILFIQLLLKLFNQGVLPICTFNQEIYVYAN